MKKFAINLVRYQFQQGFFLGFLIWVKLFKRKGIISITPLHSKFPVLLRADTSDVPTFDEIFIATHYNFDYGFIPTTIVDCGANIGLTTVYYKNKFPDATIIAVEPELSNFEMLKKNVDGYNKIYCINAAVWSNETKLKGSDKFGKEKWMYSVEEVKENDDVDTIPSISINMILEKFKLKEIGILKIDIEGAEIELFSNNTENWLPKTKCIVIELHDKLRKGTGTAFFKATSTYNFSYYQNGVNLFCINNSFR